MATPKIISQDTVRNILTLRYDPSQKAILPKITTSNFKNNLPSIDHVEYLIEKSLKKIQTNPKKIAIALSGGVDSTLALFFLRKMFPESQIETISVKFAESHDESSTASKIAKYFDANHHVLPVENYLLELPKAIGIVKMPFWDLHWYYVAKKASELSKYLASGDGGDEIFGGYTFRYKKFLSLINSKSTPLQKVRAYMKCHERDSVPDQRNLFGKKAGFSWNKIHPLLHPYFSNSLSLIDQVFLADYNGKLLYNFSIVNKMVNDHFKLTSITPLISKDLITYVMGISSDYKYDAKTNLGKLVLRKIISKYNLDFLISDQKLGFSVDTINLWKSHGHRLCTEYLKDARIIDDGWISKKWVGHYINQRNLDVRYINKFLGLLAFEIWYGIFITKEIKSNSLLV